MTEEQLVKQLLQHRQTAHIQQAAPPEPQPNAEPPHVTVQDIKDFYDWLDNLTTTYSKIIAPTANAHIAIALFTIMFPSELNISLLL